MTDEWGHVKYDPSVSAEVVDLVINNVSPKIDINPAGGTLITVEGANFPSSQDARYNLQIIFDAAALCEI